MKRAKMTGWYDPARLISIAVRVVISTVFGEFADRREAMAAAREIDPDALDSAYDYRTASEVPFWFDYVADVGEGWDSTFAIARLLSQRKLVVEGLPEELPTGRILVMGGDQVYPTASREDYAQKFLAPYAEAARINDFPASDQTADVFAIPGNHDWYDGLSSFLGVFCSRRNADAWAEPRKGRVIGGRQTRQTRSYFAIALPQNWWIWGTDIQLDGYIDQPQLDFFAHVAKCWMPPGSKVILCTAEPTWMYVDVNDPEKNEFKNFSYMEGVISQPERGHRLALVLTGDSHHYGRWTEGDRNYIVAGGGGAFLHPTHNLTDKIFDWPYPPPGEPEIPGVDSYRRDFKIVDPATGTPRTFPDANTSRALTWRNLAFAYLNPRYAALMGFLAAIFAWLLSFIALSYGTTLHDALAPAGQGSFPLALKAYFTLLLSSPWPALMLLAAGAGYVYFSDYRHWGLRIMAGGLHALAQFAVSVSATVLIALYAPFASFTPLLILYIGVISGILSATLLGGYLILCLNWRGQHWDEAFSSLRIADYKNFLRLRIDADGSLTIFPIGLKKVPHDEQSPSPLKPHLIESPIRII